MHECNCDNPIEGFVGNQKIDNPLMYGTSGNAASKISIKNIHFVVKFN